MRKLALTLSALGLLAFSGAARADQKTENSEKTDSTTTLTGKHKTTRTKSIERADGSGVETKVETTTPKEADKRDNDAEPARRDDQKSDVTEKTERHTTLGGKQQVKTTKKMEKADGTQAETTTTTTEPDHDKK